MRPSVIAIDGPAGSGKTIVGQRVARDLGYLYLDTGALYRALAWLALDRGVDPRDGPALARLARGASIETHRTSDGEDPGYSVTVDERDVTRDLSLPDVANAASIIAAHPEVRAEMVPVQRQIADRGHVVIAGRDIGTVVAPDAGLKLFLDAPLPVRISRRIEQLTTLGMLPDPGKVAAEMAVRDRQDRTRAVGPLKPAPDAVILDTSTMSIDEEVAQILDLIAKRDP
ncbi:MAG: (d)CMP kinase [Chloroflexota bacterium]